MKTFAHYDSGGIIRAIVRLHDSGGHAGLVPRLGHMVTEITGLEAGSGELDLVRIRKDVAKRKLLLSGPAKLS